MRPCIFCTYSFLFELTFSVNILYVSGTARSPSNRGAALSFVGQMVFSSGENTDVQGETPHLRISNYFHKSTSLFLIPRRLVKTEPIPLSRFLEKLGCIGLFRVYLYLVLCRRWSSSITLCLGMTVDFVLWSFIIWRSGLV